MGNTQAPSRAPSLVPSHVPSYAPSGAPNSFTSYPTSATGDLPGFFDTIGFRIHVLTTEQPPSCSNSEADSFQLLLDGLGGLGEYSGYVCSSLCGSAPKGSCYTLEQLCSTHERRMEQVHQQSNSRNLTDASLLEFLPYNECAVYSSFAVQIIGELILSASLSQGCDVSLLNVTIDCFEVSSSAAAHLLPLADAEPQTTSKPSVVPSTAPTQTPTTPPSSLPTSNPSKAPTETPSTAPSLVPSSAPTQTPSLSPSSSAAQTFTSFPTSSSATVLPSFLDRIGFRVVTDGLVCNSAEATIIQDTLDLVVGSRRRDLRFISKGRCSLLCSSFPRGMCFKLARSCTRFRRELKNIPRVRQGTITANTRNLTASGFLPPTECEIYKPFAIHVIALVLPTLSLSAGCKASILNATIDCI